MSVDGGIRPQSLLFLLAHLHLGAHFGLNPSQIIDRNLGDEATSDEQGPAPSIEYFAGFVAVHSSFEVAIDPSSKGDVFSRGEFLREIGPFSNIGLQSAIERFGL
ncbi:MAG: hypothetical protein JSS26_10045 [Nitrospira sp.]|nr:hypothetical protein [Nitrospira sp.]